MLHQVFISILLIAGILLAYETRDNGRQRRGTRRYEER
jgi:hypothetical protein